MEKSTEQQLAEHCKQIADDLEAIVNMNYCTDENGNREEDWEDDEGNVKEGLKPVDMMDYFTDGILDVLYMVRTGNNRSKPEYCHARIMVACGGPNIYINTLTGDVEGYWYAASATCALSKAARDAVDETMEELYNC